MYKLNESLNNTRNETSTIILALMFVMSLVGTLNATSSKVNEAGLLLILALLGTGTFLFFAKVATTQKIYKIHFKLLVISIIMLIIMLMSTFETTKLKGMTQIAQFFFCVGLTLFMSGFNWDYLKSKIIGRIVSIYIISNFFMWLVSGFSFSFTSIYNNPNVTGSLLFFSLFFVIRYRQETNNKLLSTITIILCLLMIFSTSSRAILIAAFSAFATFYLWGFITKNKRNFITVFALVFSFLLSLIFIYPQLSNWKYFYYFENLSWRYLNKGLMSGREDIWSYLVYRINQKPLLGFGSGTLPDDILHNGLSSHNLYLQIAMQNGYIGLGVFSLLLFSIWLLFWDVRHIKSVQLTASFFIAILIHQSFEVTLTQNQLSVGILQWLIISVGISYAVHYKKQEKV